MTVQIIDIAGQKMAMLPVADYQRLIDLAETQQDIAAASNAERRRLDGEEYIPSSVVDHICDGASALRVWRKYRGLSGEQLAKAIGVTRMQISRMETREQAGSVRSWRAAAEALNVTIDDIMPGA
jgi:DNA-binding XRE family transcriptional regulator